MKKTIGGDRLGAGKKQKVTLHNYERSTHNMSYTWRSTMASGTLVPFLSEVGLPGDSFDINLNVDVLTHPTIGPLFGSYKVQLDLFQVPIRLYNAKLHMNMLGIGMKMSNIKLPQLELEIPPYDKEETETLVEENKFDNSQINASSLLSYLNIRGIGHNPSEEETTTREFNAIPLLAYWDIYKNYYANKQEEIGMVIHTPVKKLSDIILGEVGNTEETRQRRTIYDLADGDQGNIVVTVDPNENYSPMFYFTIDSGNTQDALYMRDKIIIALNNQSIPNGIETYPTPRGVGVLLKDFAGRVSSGTTQNPQQTSVSGWGTNWNNQVDEELPWTGIIYGYTTIDIIETDFEKVNIEEFPLENIDKMRTKILQFTGQSAFTINDAEISPYGKLLENGKNDEDKTLYSRQFTQEGLGLKTYQSDLFNNWISTEWIDGDNGVNAITAISTTEDFITIDQINLSRKIYDMLNRIAISGGSYDDWLDATYMHERSKSVENPIYMGGLSTELVFEEVVSNAQTEDSDGINPLGTLAGRGRLNQKRKGGEARIKIDEPSYIMGIISLTPRLDYSQGNKWDTGLKTMDDFHKPALDQIGFQDLITEQMAWWESTVDTEGGVTQKSIGKQPAWINYMTNVNQVRGNFADANQQMWMTLNRKYETEVTEEGIQVGDLTTYIDPSKFNHIFADTRLDAQNFWTQIGVGMQVRRKMSAKIMPNL